MPRTAVLIFQEEEGSVPFLEWFENLPAKVQDKCRVRLERLAERGHELRRPEADYLRDGVYELRARHGHVNYRILYFFHGQAAVLSHGLQKEKRVPPGEIDRASARAARFHADPEKHTFQE